MEAIGRCRYQVAAVSGSALGVHGEPYYWKPDWGSLVLLILQKRAVRARFLCYCARSAIWRTDGQGLSCGSGKSQESRECPSDRHYDHKKAECRTSLL